MRRISILRPPGIKAIISYISCRRLTIGKFLIVSGSAVAINLVLLFLMVKYLGFSTRLGENVANAVSMELTIIYNFFLSRAITFADRHKEYGKRLLVQMLKFQLTIGATTLFRLGLFPLLQLLGVFYILNAAIGIAIAAVFNFVVYDTLIFKKGE
jgi:dolichol-phosphate mannosyltransferase